jgi:hypothetical protein
LIWQAAPLLTTTTIPALDASQEPDLLTLTVLPQAAHPSPTGLSTWLEPGPLTFPNLTVTLSETSAKDWHLWFEDFVVKGHNDDTDEKAGVLTLLDEQRGEAWRGSACLAPAPIARRPSRPTACHRPPPGSGQRAWLEGASRPNRGRFAQVATPIRCHAFTGPA